MTFFAAPATFGAETLAGLSGTGALAGGAGAAGGLAGLGAALGPIGWAGLGLSAIGTAANLFGGGQAAADAKRQILDQREYQFGSSLAAPLFANVFDYNKAKQEIGLTNSPAFRRAEATKNRANTFTAFAGKYGPSMARLSAGSFYG